MRIIRFTIPGGRVAVGIEIYVWADRRNVTQHRLLRLNPPPPGDEPLIRIVEIADGYGDGFFCTAVFDRYRNRRP